MSEKSKTGGLCGLSNLGNTCFMNSCMQLLSHTYELNNVLDTYLSQKRSKCHILSEWNELRLKLWSGCRSTQPDMFVKAVHSVAKDDPREFGFATFTQNDAMEFLLFMLETFHAAMSREVVMKMQGNASTAQDKMAVVCFDKIKALYEKDYSDIWSIFGSVHVSQIATTDGTNILSNTPEALYTLSVSLPTHIKYPTLIDCIDDYTSVETLDGENGVINEATGVKEDVTKTVRFWSLPKILIVDIKRFNSSNRKKQTPLDFPLSGLDLSEYVVGYRSNQYVYDLFGVCNHSGGVMGGHYTSFIKPVGGSWYHFNDMLVSPIDETKIVTPKAYCLFYRKREK
jgi:ubiquitin carboxyl-terminal hydrolase 8